MKKLFVLILMAGLLFALDAPAKSNKPIKGTIASFNDLVMGGSGKVNKSKAKELVAKGSPLVFKVGTGKKAKVYFVFNEDGTYAGKKLAKYAANNFIGIIGKIKKVHGINVIIAEKIESMD